MPAMPIGRPAAHDAVRISVCFLPHDDSGRSTVLWRSNTGHGSALVSAARYDEEAVACGHPPGLLPCDEHLRMDPERPEHQPLLDLADVLVSGEPLRFEVALRRVDTLLARHPGCLVAAVPGPGAGYVIGVRDALGGVRFLWPERGAGGVPAAPGAVASVVHAWTAAGRAPDALRSVVPLPRP
ncbi:hypothetical protein DF268_16395 [Streptomyces sp. V2]|nr:hypothetical protein DF268_16395 [Streptomyces sp. V2]